MSDINIILDGVIAFIVSASLCILLIAGIVICFLYGLKARRTPEGFKRQRVSPHLFGMSLSLAGFAVILLTIILTDNTAPPHTLNRWLDNRVWLWAAAVLLLWPLGAYFWKKRQGDSIETRHAHEI